MFDRPAELRRHGSVIRSWLLDLGVDAFNKHDKSLTDIAPYVEDSGEGRWTVEAAMAEDVPAPVISLSLIQRFVPRQEESFSAKVIAALRNEFGGRDQTGAVKTGSRTERRAEEIMLRICSPPDGEHLV